MRRVHNHDSESQFAEIVLELESAVQREQDIKSFLRKLHQLMVRGPEPIGFAYGTDFVISKKIANARVNAFVYEDTSSARS